MHGHLEIQYYRNTMGTEKNKRSNLQGKFKILQKILRTFWNVW